MVTITFRTTGVWGVGTGVDLTAVQIDTNFYNIKTTIEFMEANPPQPNNIANITVVDNQMTIELEDSTTFGPFTLPVAEFRDRGEWQPLTNYVYCDIFTHAVGLYMVLQDHTSAAAFDPNASNGFGPLYRTLFDASGMTMTYLDAGYPAAGTDLHAFEVFSIPDDGVYMVLVDHIAVDPFDPDLLVGPDPAYKKIFSAIETNIARLQFQYAGTFPADGSLIWKIINDDLRQLDFAANMPESIAHIEVACTAITVFKIKVAGVDKATVTFNPGALLDGAGGQFGEFLSDGFSVATGTVFRVHAPSLADATARFLTLALVGSYVEL